MPRTSRAPSGWPTPSPRRAWSGRSGIERYNPALQQARPGSSPASWARSSRSPPAARARSPARIADVGVVKDLATHDIDLTAWVARQPYQAVSARTANRSGRPHEDLVAITGILADGTVTNHLVNGLSAQGRG